MNAKISIAVLALAGFSLPAVAAPAACSLNDFVGFTATACSGFVGGNLLKGNTGDLVKSDVAAQLGLLGLTNTSTFTYQEKIPNNYAAMTINFGTLLYGDTVIGVHLGGSSFAGNATAFYRFDAGNAGVDVLQMASHMTPSSGVALYSTSLSPQAIPEPSTYALLLAGLAGVGFVARRRASV
jgi:hypothetical protein